MKLNCAAMLTGTAVYPTLRYMGSKQRLLPWIESTLGALSFTSALDLFSGSGSVAYLLKQMGKRVTANDFLQFAHHLAVAAVENDSVTIGRAEVARLCTEPGGRSSFIQDTFSGIFFTPEDLRFLDIVSANLAGIEESVARAVVQASLTRACLKGQPRGVFTVRGRKYDDGRRDLRLSLEEHFRESIAVFNSLVIANGHLCRALNGNAMTVDAGPVDLVYMDPPYVPRSDDNCYVKRYHFLEGLASYWQAPGTEIVTTSQVKKIPKRFTPFSYRDTALEAFETLFRRYADSTLVLSYSSNGYPDLATLTALMERYKRRVDVTRKEHRYHFGTHTRVSGERTLVSEYLIVGQD